ncbi:MAG: hypothetical protein GY909_13690 [Oligoflexia bacterium]|nr:hypothetical protein [Oligoflexia bacterium]
MKLLLITLAFITSTFAAEETLLKTYQRELAFLIAQKKSLSKQLRQSNRVFKKKTNLLDNKNKKLEEKYVNLSTDNKKLENTIEELNKKIENKEVGNSLIETTINQGKLSLNADVNIKNKDEALNTIFAKLWVSLHKSKRVYSVDSSFFLPNGNKVNGEVIKFGSVASFGLYENMAGALMPIGSGKLQLQPAENIEQIKNIANETSSWAPFFLYESTEKAITKKEEKSVMETLKAGGAVAYVIAMLGILALIFIAIRSWLLYRTSKVDNKVLAAIKNEEINESLEENLSATNSAFGRVLSKTYQSINLNREERENVIQESILGELNLLDKFGAMILVLAAISPLLGLLGTVTGMISTFDIITEFGTGDPKLLSNGISEALITTKLGLVVAIPALLMGNLLGSWSNKIKLMLETEALRLSNFADKKNKEVLNND